VDVFVGQDVVQWSLNVRREDELVDRVGVDSTWLRQMLGDEDATIRAVELSNFHAAPTPVSPVDVFRHPVDAQPVHLQQVYEHTASYNIGSSK